MSQFFMAFLKKHPAFRPTDVIKYGFQATFGAEHMLMNTDYAKKLFFEEYDAAESTTEPLYEELTDDICRVNIGAWKREGLKPEALFEMFLKTASIKRGSEDAFKENMEGLLQTVKEYAPLNVYEECSNFYKCYLEGQIQAVHHSEEYREAYNPHYRVVLTKLVRDYLKEGIEMFPLLDYSNCTTNLASSILKKFGVEPENATLPMADKLLEDEYDNVVLILLDGLGMAILEKNASPEGFFRKNLYGEYKSVFLPTTVAATTSILSGLNPSEHAWLGWDCFYPEVDKNVTVFLNVLTSTEEPAADFNVARTLRPYKDVISRINEAGGEAHLVASFLKPEYRDFTNEKEAVLELCRKPGKKYIYCYNQEPDGMMHETGTASEKSKKTISELEAEVEDLCIKLKALDKKTLVMVTADHGQIDPRPMCILDYPDVCDCLVRMPSLEPRALNLFVKPEAMERFPEIFNGHFSKDFKLYTKDEVIKGKLFGSGKEHPKFRDMLGDYIALAISDAALYFTHEYVEIMKGFHGGMSLDELRVPLIKIDC